MPAAHVDSRGVTNAWCAQQWRILCCVQSAPSCFFQCKPLILLYEVARVLKEAIEEGKCKADLEAPWVRAIFDCWRVLYYSLLDSCGWWTNAVVQPGEHDGSTCCLTLPYNKPVQWSQKTLHRLWWSLGIRTEMFIGGDVFYLRLHHTSILLNSQHAQI